MPIDPSAVQWDSINPGAVQWDQSAADMQRADAKATSVPQAVAIGAGRMTDRLWEGAKQGGYGVGAILSELLPDRLKQVAQDALAQKLLTQQKQQTDNTARYKPIAEEHPIATTVGEALPLMAAPQLRVLEGAGALPAMANAATSAAVPSMLEYGTAGERTERGAVAGVSGAAGAGLLALGGKALKPVQGLLTPEQQRLAQVAEDAGIKLSAGDKTGNKFMKTTEAVLQEMPATAGAQQALAQGKREAFTRAVMAKVGDDAAEASPSQLAASRGRIGGDFDRIFSKVNVPLSPPEVIQSLGAIVQDANRNLVPEQARLVANRADDLLSKVDADGNVPGSAYQAWRSVVQKQSANAGGDLKGALRDLYRAVDSSAYDAANAVGEASNLSAARGQYRNLLAVEDAMKQATDGHVPAGRFLSSANRFATPDVQDLARAGKAFVSDQVGNPGTAQRLMAQQMLSGGLLGAGVGGVTYGVTQDPMQALKMGSMAAAGRVVIPKIAQTAINSGAGQRYLTKGIGRELTPLEEALMERAVRLGAVSGSRALVGQ